MKSLICLCATALVSVAWATPPVLSNVRASQRSGTKLVDIYYDASDADGDLLKVRVEVSDNDGVKYSIPARTFTGDIGEGVRPGSNKHIVWDAGTDWDGEYSDQMRVKVFAIDAQGFPGMEWGNEVAPGGFLLGQDGGAEGSGESQHVNIPWSYWVAKYEVTNQQYCDYLNAALVAGHVALSGTTRVITSDGMPANSACPLEATLCFLGDSRGIRWNVNNFEPVKGAEEKPVSTTWFGAMAFCRFYGYDLPTEAEWEKAVRGPDNDDQDEHLVYPWGNSWSSSMATTSLVPVNAYDHAIGGYGLCGAIGNAAEWTRSRSDYTILSYPTQEDLTDDRHLPFVDDERVVKGYYDEAIYSRRSWDSGTDSMRIGFRPVRRQSNIADVTVTREVYEDFETLAANALMFSHSGKTWKTDCSEYGNYDENKLFRLDAGVEEGKGVGCPKSSMRSFYLYIPSTSKSLAFVRLKAKNTDSSRTNIQINSTGGWGGFASLPAYMTTFKKVELPVVLNASSYYIYVGYYISLDEIELWTLVK